MCCAAHLQVLMYELLNMMMEEGKGSSQVPELRVTIDPAYA